MRCTHRSPIAPTTAPAHAGARRSTRDELGYLNIKTEQTNIFFKRMEERHRRRPTLISTNLPYPAWQDFLGNPALTKALLSRLRERCHTVTMDEVSQPSSTPRKRPSGRRRSHPLSVRSLMPHPHARTAPAAADRPAMATASAPRTRATNLF